MTSYIHFLIRFLKLLYPHILLLLLLLPFNSLALLKLKQKLILIVSFLFLLAIYRKFSSKTTLIYKPTAFHEKLLSNCKKIKNSKYVPPLFLSNFLLQLVLNPLCRIKTKNPIHIIPNKVNNCGLYIEWVEFDGENNSHNRPVFLIVPGITGSFEDSYIYNIAYQAKMNNYDVVIYKMRTMSNEMRMPSNKNEYVSFTKDLDDALEYIHNINKNKIYAVSGSFGANTLTNYLGTYNVENKYISGGVSLCNLFDFFLCQRVGYNTALDDLILYFYRVHYLPGCINANKYRKNFFDIDKMNETEVLTEFDSLFFKTITGCNNNEDYYRKISSFGNIKNINVPFLFINSKDDPVATILAIPVKDIRDNDNCMMILTDHGSHMSFIERKGFGLKGCFKMWFIDIMIEYINFLRDNMIIEEKER